MNDLVKREAVLTAVNCWIGSGEYRFTNATDYLNTRIKELPAEQEPCVVNTKDLSDDEIKKFKEVMKKVTVQVILKEPKTDILDKIREEIEEKAERYCLSKESTYMGQVEWSERLIKENDVLKIIDKYKESEG